MTDGRVNPSQRLEDQGITGLGPGPLQLLRGRPCRGRGDSATKARWARAARSWSPPASTPAARPRTSSSCARPRSNTRSGGKTTRRWRPTAFERLHADMLAHMQGARLFRAGPLRRRRPGASAGRAGGDGTGLARPVHPPPAAPARRAPSSTSFIPEFTIINCPSLQGRPGPPRLPRPRRSSRCNFDRS